MSLLPDDLFLDGCMGYTLQIPPGDAHFLVNFLGEICYDGIIKRRNTVKQPILNLYIFHAVLSDGTTSTVDIYAVNLIEATSKLEKDHGVKFPNYELVRIIYCGHNCRNINIR